MTTPKKIIVMTGATGFVGSPLALRLFRAGYDIRILTRDPERACGTSGLPYHYYRWLPESEPAPREALEGAHAIINLVGESIAEGRWTAEKKRKLHDSRILATRNLLATVAELAHKPEVLVSTSAVGFYGDRGDEILTETARQGEGFLADLCRDWELEAMKAQSLGLRVACLRVGVVLGDDGGALAKMLTPFRMGVGGILGDGRQWMSWIHLDDLVALYQFALENDGAQGVLNATAPNPATNHDFTKALGTALNRPSMLPVPKVALKAIFGELSQILLHSQRVQPNAALKKGFTFKFADLAPALDDIVNPEGHKGAYRLRAAQWIPRPNAAIFSFYSDAKNLEKITPSWLNFNIVNLPERELHAGDRIDYKLKIHGIPVRWQSSIDTWQPGQSFVDRQLKGPYREWIHTHTFEETQHGTLILDEVIYEIPFGPVGDLARELFVKKDLKEIFSFRQKAISEHLRTETH